MKKCSTCKKNKPKTDFNKNKHKKDGLQTYCKKCSKGYGKKYYKNNKEKHIRECKLIKERNREKTIRFIYEYLIKNPCNQCGETDPVLLEFDHIKDKKIAISIAVASNWSITNLKKEIEKCQILCANCHRLKSAEEQGWYLWKITRNK